MDRLPPPRADWCLFLDFDGTLVELNERPDAVTTPEALAALLRALLAAFDGAVAIVSGRSVASLERLLAPLALPLAGIHGLERRDARGRLQRDPAAAAALAPLRDAVAGFVARYPGVRWEDKGTAIAVHFREAPAAAGAVRDFLAQQCAALGPGFHVQPGKAVYELKPAGRDKGHAVAEFLAEPPFAGRTPVFVGDDVTDEDAFTRVNALGGVSIRVGDPDASTAAHYRIDSVTDTLAWLRGLPDAVAAR